MCFWNYPQGEKSRTSKKIESRKLTGNLIRDFKSKVFNEISGAFFKENINKEKSFLKKIKIFEKSHVIWKGKRY